MPFKIGLGYSIEKDPLAAANEASHSAHISLGTEKIDFVLIFFTIDLAHPTVFARIAEIFHDAPLLGCSSAALMSAHGITNHGIAVLAFCLPEGVYFNMASCDVSNNASQQSGELLAEKLLYGFKDIRRDLSILFLDGLLTDASAFMSGIQSRLGKSFPVVGGSASDALCFKQTFIYADQKLSSHNAASILLGGKFRFGIGIKHGLKPIGKPHEITSAAGNVIFEIDGQPALNLYQDYLGIDAAQLRKQVHTIAIYYPLGIYVPGEDEYLLRSIQSINSDDSITFQGDIPQNSIAHLMIGTKESCLNATHQALDEVLKRMEGHNSDLMLIFESVSRYMLMGRHSYQGIEILRKRLGKNVPLLGIFTYGEQAPLKSLTYYGRTHFHNQTICLLSMGA